MAEPESLDFEQVRRLVPQAHPFLMVDRVEELHREKRIVAVKNISGNEAFFQGHFPNLAIMPAALILEGLGQATIVLIRRSFDSAAALDPDEVYLFGSVHARMLRPVFPGNVLKLEVDLVKLYGNGGAAEGRATVDGNVCVEAELFFSKVKISELKASPPARP